MTNDMVSQFMFPSILVLVVSDMAAVHFLRMLIHFRTVILQDAVILQEKFPDHPIFRAAVFQDEGWAMFKERLSTAMATTANPLYSRLETIAPTIHSGLQGLTQETRRLNGTQAQILERIEEGFQTLTSSEQRQTELQRSINLIIRRGLNTMQTEIESQFQVTAPASLDATASSPLQQVAATSTARTDSATGDMDAPGLAAADEEEEEIPVHPMATVPNMTVEDLWTEWYHGFQNRPEFPNKPSVESLDRTHGNRWRNNKRPAIKKMYANRKKIIDFIHAVAESTELEADIVANGLHNFAAQGSKTLNWLTKKVGKEESRAELLEQIRVQIQNDANAAPATE